MPVLVIGNLEVVTFVVDLLLRNFIGFFLDSAAVVVFGVVVFRVVVFGIVAFVVVDSGVVVVSGIVVFFRGIVFFIEVFGIFVNGPNLA